MKRGIKNAEVFRKKINVLCLNSEYYLGVNVLFKTRQTISGPTVAVESGYGLPSELSFSIHPAVFGAQKGGEESSENLGFNEVLLTRGLKLKNANVFFLRSDDLAGEDPARLVENDFWDVILVLDGFPFGSYANMESYVRIGRRAIEKGKIFFLLLVEGLYRFGSTDMADSTESEAVVEAWEKYASAGLPVEIVNPSVSMEELLETVFSSESVKSVIANIKEKIWRSGVSFGIATSNPGFHNDEDLNQAWEFFDSIFDNSFPEKKLHDEKDAVLADSLAAFCKEDFFDSLWVRENLPVLEYVFIDKDFYPRLSRKFLKVLKGKKTVTERRSALSDSIKGIVEQNVTEFFNKFKI